MRIELSPQDLLFRDEVRAFLDEKFTPELREAAARQTGVFAEGGLARRWHGILYEKGWVAPAWPKVHGGPGWTQVQRYVFESECAEAGVPALPAMGLQMCGPVLMGHGDHSQKAYFLPRILSGEHYWCQGYSEPQAGSDLASLQARAVRDGDHYVVTGSKIWTTHAQYANWMFLLVRTSSEVKPQAGITFLLLDMASPGISLQPIISISGEHEVNQVFFDGVRVPVANRVGEENKGWAVAKYLLEFERGGGAWSARIKGLLRQVKRVCESELGDGGRPLIADPGFRRRLAELECAATAVEFTERRVISQLSTGANAGDAAASMLKLRGSETQQIATELLVDAVAHYARPDQRPALNGDGSVVGPEHARAPVSRYLNARASTIFGGSSEIQHNILARAALGL